MHFERYSNISSNYIVCELDYAFKLSSKHGVVYELHHARSSPRRQCDSESQFEFY